jgi:hypothetical protein
LKSFVGSCRRAPHTTQNPLLKTKEITTMSTQAQILANQANAQKSCGPKTEIGKQASSQNRLIHGLSDPGDVFFLQACEDESQFVTLKARLNREHQPQTETERILVRRMVESEWLRLRALRLQNFCQDPETGFLREEKQFALYLRYQTTHERGFYKALNELQKLRAQRRNEQIGFESQKRAAAAELRAAEAHNLKKQEFEWKKKRAMNAPPSENTKKEVTQPIPSPETSPGAVKIAA